MTSVLWTYKYVYVVLLSVKLTPIVKLSSNLDVPLHWKSNSDLRDSSDEGKVHECRVNSINQVRERQYADNVGDRNVAPLQSAEEATSRCVPPDRWTNRWYITQLKTIPALKNPNQFWVIPSINSELHAFNEWHVIVYQSY